MNAVVATFDTRGAAQESAQATNIIRRMVLRKFGKLLRFDGHGSASEQQAVPLGCRTSRHRDYRNLLRRAEICIALREYTQALGHFAQIAEMAPNHADIYIRMGSVLTKTKNYHGAIEKYELAIWLIENGKARYANAMFDLARAYKKMGTVNLRFGSRQEAERCLRISVMRYEKLGNNAAHNMDYAKALNWLGEILSDNGMEKEAKAMFDQSRAVRPDLERPRDHLLDMWKNRIECFP